MENNQEKKQSVGAMWSKVGKNEKQTRYYSISLDIKQIMDDNGNIPEKVQLIAFRNFFKTEDRQPDYRIYKSERREVSNDDQKFEKWVNKEAEPQQETLEEQDDNQIPF